MYPMLASDVLDSVLKVADQTLRTLFAPARSLRAPELPADSRQRSRKAKGGMPPA
jgi:hypothetical protein